ncbi:Werner Syndrome-like exonuclease [Quillaja saponaria]|uniref:Werner Syndrome-like exonuclease n=1 Tax=Quillaja saponaria TaxID=32244 RepID=A0AAD7VI12_QUISA|nr:Werner Syndrome-like exonuclease [Quillaja saponaria]
MTFLFFLIVSCRRGLKFSTLRERKKENLFFFSISISISKSPISPSLSTMTISIVDYGLPDDTHNVYDVIFYSDTIHTLLTNSPSIVDSWLSEIDRSGSNRLIVGLDVEWRPSFNRHIQNPVATLQLCVSHRCLIFQLIHAPKIPQSLIDFLGNTNYTFVGVGIEPDVEKLLEDYGLSVATVVDVRVLAADKLGLRELRNAGLKALAMQVLGKEIEKPKRVTMSRWDNPWLNSQQVQYACIDAFVSFEIARNLYARA